MRQVTVNVYRLEELSDREPALENVREMLGEIGVARDDLRDIFSEELSELGYPISDICWSPSHSQGDGVAFYGDIVELGKVRDRLAPEIVDLDGLYVELVSLSNYYSHYNTIRVAYTYDGEDDRVQTFIDAIQEDVREVSKRLTKMGYECLEYIESEDYISDFVASNDIEFTENGEIYV